ncbi:MAG: RHS repeat-associated core domain-containing protein [Fimbriimonadaceae bacterium]|nr:RHS repeat-associated core domain-containing protein [Fimbriimonadaceae bacterium]
MSRGLPAAVLEDAGSLFAADFAVTDYPKPDVRLDRVLDTVQARAKGGDTNRVGQYFWGLRYIDDLVFRREDRDLTNEPPPAEDPAEPDFDDAETPGWFALTDVQFSVVALLTPEGRIVERVVYDPYGRGRHHFAADYDGNGAVEVPDLNGTYGHLTAWFADDMQADWDRNGTTYGDVPDIFAFQTDWFAQTGNAVAAGQISRRYAAGSGINANAPDNMIGYCGYVFNPETDDYTVRFRHYDPEIGRWLQRDPAGYVDGPSLLQYVHSEPVSEVDPTGLRRTPPVEPPPYGPQMNPEEWTANRKLWDRYHQEMREYRDWKVQVWLCKDYGERLAKQRKRSSAIHEAMKVRKCYQFPHIVAATELQLTDRLSESLLFGYVAGTHGQITEEIITRYLASLGVRLPRILAKAGGPVVEVGLGGLTTVRDFRSGNTAAGCGGLLRVAGAAGIGAAVGGPVGFVVGLGVGVVAEAATVFQEWTVDHSHNSKVNAALRSHCDYLSFEYGESLAAEGRFERMGKDACDRACECQASTSE